MIEYDVVMLTKSGVEKPLRFFAKDRDDAIEYTRKHFRSTYRKVISARQVKGEVAHHVTRGSDGSFSCGACKARWDADDAPPAGH